MWIWIDNSDEDVRFCTDKDKLKESVRADYEDKEKLVFEDRDECIAVLPEGEDMEIGIIIKGKEVK